MSVVNFEIKVADFNNQDFVLLVDDAPQLGPDLSTKGFPINRETLCKKARPDLTRALHSRDTALRTVGSEASVSIETFGTELFDLLIWNHSALHESWGHFATLPQKSKRLRLALTGESGVLPWETLCDRQRMNGFLARQISVVRYSRVTPPIPPVNLQQNDPLRMLVVFANPDGDLESAIQAERAAITSALASVTGRNHLCIDFVKTGGRPTLDQISSMVNNAGNQGYHILHIFAHGDNRGQGQLQFEGAGHGDPASVTWEDLRAVLGPTLPSLRLIVLNACELAQPDERLVSYTPFSNLAASFLNAGAAIVVAMQYPIRTDTASIFAKTFYGQVGPYLFASAQNIEEAVQEARHAIARAQNAVEWITPVVFTRMQGEEIFRIPEARLRVYAEDIQKREKMNKLLGEARTLFDNGAWVDAAEKVKEILQIDPTEEEALKLKNELVRIASDKIQDQNQEEILGKNIFNALK